MINSAINIDDLLIGTDGKISKAAAVMMGAFIVTSWIMAKLTLTDHMTEGYFLAYLGAWVAPTVTAMIVNAPVLPQSTESTTIVNSTTTTGKP